MKLILCFSINTWIKLWRGLRAPWTLSSFYTSTKSWRSYIFTSVCLCVCVSNVFLWTKFQPNGWTDLDAVIVKRLLSTLAQTLLKLVTLGHRRGGICVLWMLLVLVHLFARKHDIITLPKIGLKHQLQFVCVSACLWPLTQGHQFQ